MVFTLFFIFLSAWVAPVKKTQLSQALTIDEADRREATFIIWDLSISIEESLLQTCF